MSRTVRHTRLGITHEIPAPQQRPPLDWDRIVSAAVAAGTILFVLISICWSTASIGGLFARAVPAPVGYAAAVGFDLAWVLCMGLEWLDRHEPDRARMASGAGMGFLLLAMGAVAVHGWLTGGAAVGCVGCAVSLIAKALWMLTIRRSSRPLGYLDREWLAAETASLHTELTLTALHRQLSRARARIASERAALGIDDQPLALAPVTTDSSLDTSALVRSAVRAAASTLPDATPLELVEQLARVGVDTDVDTVRRLSGHADDTTDSRSGPVASPQPPTVTDTIRQLVRTGVTDADLVLEGVRAVHGDGPAEATVDRIRRDVVKGIR